MKKRKIYFFVLILIISILILNLISSAPPMENIGNKTFIAGESFSFGDDYNLYVNSIDSGANKANLILTKATSTLFQKWFSEGSLLNQPGVITAHVYSITSNPSGGNEILTLTDIMAIGKTPADEPEPTTGECTEQWKCSLWRACSNGTQTRSCDDLNDCGTTNNKPNLTKTCYVQPLPGNPCTENWQCSDWSACINNLFTRTCTDANNCGTINDKPTESLACDPNIPSDPNNPNNPNNPDNPNIPNNPNNPGGNNVGSQITNIYNYYTNTGKVNTTYEIFNISGLISPDMPFGIDFLGPKTIISLIFLLILLLILLIFYIYISSAFSSLAKKKDFSHPGVAWIPIIGPFIIMSNLAKMHWWPILLLIFVPFKIIPIMFLPFPILITMILGYFGLVALLALTIFSFIWMWKTFNAVNRPGWWVLFNLVPILGNIIFLILLGVAAWGNKELPTTKQSKPSKTNSKSKKK